MKVEYSGWTLEHGAFQYFIEIDENRQDYELEYKNGQIAKQVSPFKEVTGDWNNDGDVYTQFGAWFEVPGENRGTFWTPEDMVRAAVDATDKDKVFYNHDVIRVKDVNIPPKEQRHSIDDMIRQSEQRAFHQEAERNRKMQALGIRPPGEPWAR